MNNHNNLDFDFDFTGKSRKVLLADAIREVRALRSELGGTAQKPTAREEAALRLLQQLDLEVAEFTAFPDILELKEKHFSDHGLPVPIRFKDLNKQYKFYYIHFTITLKPSEGMHFNKLKCAIEFNPDVVEGHLRPRAQMILPDRKFKQLLEVSDSLELRIGENFEFEATSPGTASVDVKAAGKLGLIAGPFTYRLKRAQLDHSSQGSEKVFWTLEGAEFFQEDHPSFIVVMQMPKEVHDVVITAALQAYHGFNVLAATLGELTNYLKKQLGTFFRKGAPVQDTQVWDITPRL